MSIGEPGGQQNPEDQTEEVQLEQQIIPALSVEESRSVVQDATPEPVPSLSVQETEPEAPVENTDGTVSTAKPPTRTPEVFGLVPAGATEALVPEAADKTTSESPNRIGGVGVDGTTFNSDIRGIETLIQAARIEHLDVHPHSERLRVSEILVDDPEGPGKERFTRPNGIEAVEEALFLGRKRVALLTIEEGGRDCTARFLVGADPNLTPRRIHPPTDPMIEPWQLARYGKSAFLLDLSDIEIENPKRLLEHLAGLHGDLRRQESFLVVVFGERDLAEPLGWQFGVIDLKRPDPYAVLRNHLLADENAAESSDDRPEVDEGTAPGGESAPSGKEDSGYAGTTDQWVAFARSGGLLDRKPPAEAVRLCKGIGEALGHWNALTAVEREALREEFQKRRHIPRSGDDRVYAEQLVLDRFQAWVTELDLWNEDNQNRPRLRTFQLAVAVVPSGDPIQIRTEATALLQILTKKKLRDAELPGEVNSDPTGEPVLSGPGTRLLARDSLAELQDGKVVFTKPGFAEAVVRYFWNDWPEYRSGLVDWLMKLATSDDFMPEDQDELKRHIGEFAIHHAQERGEFGFLYDVVAKWAGSEATLTDAAKLLEQAATTSGIARSVRDRTRQWAQQDDGALRRVVAQMCASSSFATEYPRLVTTRLGHLMEHRGDEEDDPVLSAALERACRLLVTEANQSGAVLTRLSARVRVANPEQKKRAIRLFPPIAQAHTEGAAAPALVTQAAESEPARNALIALWASALRILEDSDIQLTFNAWMDACDPREVEPGVIGVFRDAIAYDWAGAGEANHALARLSVGWKAVTDVTPQRVAEIDYRLLAAARDAVSEVERRTFLDQQRNRV